MKLKMYNLFYSLKNNTAIKAVVSWFFVDNYTLPQLLLIRILKIPS